MGKVIFYMKNNCPLCDEVFMLLEVFQTSYDFQIETRDIYAKDEWLEQYFLTIPVLEINGNQINAHKISPEKIERFLSENLKRK